MRGLTVLVWLALLGCGRAGFERLVGDAQQDAVGDGTTDAAMVVPAILQPPASCTNGVQDGYETAIDCGGLCERCAACSSETTAFSTCLCGVEWLTPWPGGGSFSAAYAASETFAILGGNSGYVLVWDGTQFSPGFVGDAQVEVASGTGPDDVWLAGSQVWHWNGVVWTKHMPPGTVNVAAIHARTPSDVWAVSRNGGVHHYDGTTWTTTTPFGATFLSGVWSRGPNDVWIGALDGRLSSWNGTALTPVPGAAFSRVNYLWGTGPSDIYVLETTGLSHWNGSTFTAMNPGITTGLEAIHGSAPNDLWVLANNLVTHWDGATWTPTPFPPGYAGSESLSTAGRTELAVAGSRVFIADDGKRLLLDGTTWRVPGLTGENLTGIWADGTVTHALGADSWLHGSAATGFVRDPAPSTLSFSGEVLGFGPSDLWVAAGGTAYQYDGSTWTPRGVASGALAGATTNDFWAIPSAAPATARHWTGTTFTNVAMPVTFMAADAWAISASDVWASGRHVTTGAPLVARWNGTSWSLVTGPPATQDLIAIWGSSSTDIWALTSAVSQNVWHYDGAVWTDRSDSGATAYAGALRGGPSGVFVWAQSRLSRWTGTAWAIVGGAAAGCPASPTASLWVTATDVWIAGRQGILGRYRI